MIRTYMVILGLLVLMAGCSRGPETARLHKDIQHKLDNQFQTGLFTIDSFSRKGSYPYYDAKTPGEKRLIYYKATIQILKSYRFSDWDGLNAGSLISILGATPLGISGINPEGNVKGDLLQIYGTAAYSRTAAGWQEVEFHPGKQTPQPQEKSSSQQRYMVEIEEDEARQKSELPLHQQYLNEIAEIARQFNNKGEAANLAFLQNELESLLKQAGLKAAKSRGWLTMATGSSLGEYYRIGKALAKILTTTKKSPHTVKAFVTSGSSENCRLLQQREVTMSFVQNDIAFMAANGTGLFKDRTRCADIRAICSLYPEAVQIIVKKQAAIDSLADLAGKRINIGPKGSGIRINALQILEVAGLSQKDFARIDERPLSIAIADFKNDKLDAIFLTSAYPAKLIQSLSGAYPLRLVAIETKVITALCRRYPFFIPIKISQKAYPGSQAEVQTVGVTAMLITHKDVPDATVTFFLEKMFANLSLLAKQSLQANYISLKSAETGISIQVHPAAKAFFARK